jgi:GNAT superfamily N-acetyltransferase
MIRDDRDRQCGSGLGGRCGRRGQGGDGEAVAAGPRPTPPRWWDGLLTETGPGFTGEDGTRTFALAEIMVREDLAGRGIAHALYNQLLAARHERRAALLVESANTAATSTGKWQLHLR